MRRKGMVVIDLRAHSTPRPSEAAVSTGWRCCSDSLLLRQSLIVSLKKSKQSDCEEKAGAGYVCFKLGSA